MNFTMEAKEGKNYDVVVCGAGTAGVIAAISASRQGADVLLVERSFCIGGMLTDGNAGITKFTEHCKDPKAYKEEVTEKLKSEPEKVLVANGIPREFAKKLIETGAGLGTHGDCGSYIFTDSYKTQAILLDMLKEADVDVLYDTRVCHVTKEADSVKSVVVVNKDGFTDYSAKCFIDCTGDADVAALAGAEFVLGASETDVAEGGADRVGHMQPMGVMYRVGNINYERLFDYLEKNPDVFVMQTMGLLTLNEARENYNKKEMCVFNFYLDNPNPETAVKIPKFEVQIYNTPTDGEAIVLPCSDDYHLYNGNGVDAKSLTEGQKKMIFASVEMTEILRKNIPGFEDAVCAHVPVVGVRETRHIVGKYTITTEDVMIGRDFEDSVACGGHHVDTDTVSDEIKNMEMNHWRFHVPYRTMVPKTVKNLLVSGRGVSASRMAFGAIRPTVTCMALGEAAGIAAAMCAKDNISPDEIDVKALRQKLLDAGAII